MFGKKKEQAEAAVNDVQEAAAVGAGFLQRHRTGSVVAAAVVITMHRNATTKIDNQLREL